MDRQRNENAVLTTVSTGMRFTTTPPSVTPGGLPASPPTTLTVLYNPLIGYISSAYSAQVSPTLSLSSRFGVNIYSYESDLAIGGEWWVGRRRGKPAGVTPPAQVVPPFPMPSLREWEEPAAVPSTRPVEALRDVVLDEARSRTEPTPRTRAGTTARPSKSSTTPAQVDTDRDGVLKARISGNWVGIRILSLIFPLLCPYLCSCPGYTGDTDDSPSHSSTKQEYATASSLLASTLI